MLYAHSAYLDYLFFYLFIIEIAHEVHKKHTTEKNQQYSVRFLYTRA